jgi:chloramphenicol-sensitive protein RarD
MTRDESTLPAHKEASLGTAFGLAAYGMWGLFPLYWKSLSAVPPVQILAHRIAWAFVFTLILSVALKKAAAFKALLHNPKRLLATAAAGLLISVNWGIYIWAVNIGQIVETSIGYYLNPLISVVLGATVLREKLDRGIIVSCVIAGLGIAILTFSYGRLPWIALSLAASFSLYGLIKKMTGLDALTGLTAETAVVFPVALAYLWFEHAGGRGSFGALGGRETTLLALAGIVTAIPLLAYAAGVKRIALSRMGFLQYVSPTLQLLLGVLVYGETVSGIRGVAFSFVLVALAVFALTRIKKAGAA